jgi:hypothetical protein
MLSEGFQDAHCPVDRLNRLHSYCRITFDIVECTS